MTDRDALHPTGPLHRDIAGKLIDVGTYVLYAATWGRCATIKYGRVTALTERDGDLYGPVNKRTTQPTIQVVTVDREDGAWFVQGLSRWQTSGYHRGNRKPKPKIVTLGFLDRLQVLPGAMLPEGVRALLDDAHARVDAAAI